MKDAIRVRGARQHNLKGIDLDIPRRAVTVITGPSGSGKSSLVFDTIYAEGQRRYVESLSTYAKQFLERMSKPAVDSVEGLSPTIAIEQKNPTKTSRSTVGTATEVYDYLRLLFARVGRTVCPRCGREVSPDTVETAAKKILELPAGTRFWLVFPLRLSQKVTHELVVENLRALGFLRVLADGVEIYLGGAEGDGGPSGADVDLTRARELLVVVDRLKVGPRLRARLADSLGTAFAEGEGEAIAVVAEPGPGIPARLAFTELYRCPDCGLEFPPPTPQLFSFNNPVGACARCNGFGATLEYDLELIVPDPNRALAEGAVDPWTKPRYRRRRERLRRLARLYGVSVDVAWQGLPERFRQVVLYGDDSFEGVFEHLERLKEKRYKQYVRVFLRQYQSAQTCPDCRGAKLKPAALNVRVAGRTIAEVAAMTVSEARRWVQELRLPGKEAAVAETILRELTSRLRFLDEVGLGYLTLDRQTRTLSGGEAQRIGLANALGSTLVDTTYVLDEPSIGLHPRDGDRLYRLLGKLRELGNTVLVVEHDPAAMRAADHLVELGPGSGARGGELVFQGSLREMVKAGTLTGSYLSGAKAIAVPEQQRPVDGPRCVLRGARLHNLRGIDVEIPLGALTVVTGVSGSGKSTLVHDVLYRALERELGGWVTAKRHLGEPVGEYSALEGIEDLTGVVLIDQSPIGRTPRSNPVTYIGAYQEIRRIFARDPLAKKRGYGPGHFSFNTPGGRCEMCEGAGYLEVEMVFLADVFVPCDECGGKRFKPEILEVRCRGLTIHEVLQLTVDEAVRLFLREDRLGELLWQLQRVGLGYLRLGQPATTLSGGEAQRLKIARELAYGARTRGRKITLMDEPTTGLHPDDIRKLLAVVGELIAEGHTVVVIEHNLDVIKQADWIIDLGPEAGDAGGRVVAMGRPEEVVRAKGSHTGRFLEAVLENGRRGPAA
ncbi:MAG: excinuclease ABC subunit UvrA [Gemmatimonadetes bacterium]|nr:excinuclease ABC subunit UvrA [Gemmatimonadota bacterium]